MSESRERFEKWKQRYAPHDSGEDYDLLAAFKARVVPDANGHLPDTFKKPNHPTFSIESVYAVGPDAAKAGRWEGDKFVPSCDELPHTCQEGAPNSLVPYSDGPCEKCAAMNLEYWKSRAETAELKLLTFHEEIAKLVERDTRERCAQEVEKFADTTRLEDVQDLNSLAERIRGKE